MMANDADLPLACARLTLFETIANRWSVLALDLLARRSHRFNEMRRALGGISQKMLSQTLKGLEREGLVNRKVSPTVPVTVEYSLTDMGRTLVRTAEALRAWSDDNQCDIVEARERFDRERRWQGDLAPYAGMSAHG